MYARECHWFRVEQGREVRVGGLRDIINLRSFAAVTILFRQKKMIRRFLYQFHVLVLRMIIKVEGLVLVLGKM